MSRFDLRYLIPIFINSLLKPQPEGAIMLFTPHNLILHVFMLLVFSLTSMDVLILTPRPPPTNAALIRFRFGNFSPHHAILFMGSVVLPRALFWYAYPAILLFAFCFPSLLFLFRLFAGWLSKKLSDLPIWSLHISSTLNHHHVDHSTDDDQLHEHVPQVVLEFSPQDGDANINITCESV